MTEARSQGQRASGSPRSTWPAGDPRHALSPWMRAFFLGVMRRHLKASFHAVRVARPGLPRVPADLPLVMYCNHPSWWDAALLPVLCQRLMPERAAYAPIDAAALERYPFMRRLGFFGIRPDSYRGATSFLRIGRSLLAESRTLFCVTPEGAFTDPRQRPLQLRSGLAALLGWVDEVAVIPLAVEYPFWSERRPEALVRFGEPMQFGPGNLLSTAEVAGRLQQSLTAVMDRLAEDAVSRDPGRFHIVFEGSSGISGIYDPWRRLTARLRGQRFDPAHDPSLNDSPDGVDTGDGVPARPLPNAGHEPLQARQNTGAMGGPPGRV